MRAKSLLFSLLAAAALMVGCNDDPIEIVLVHDYDAPSVNGTWVHVEDSSYELTINGTTVTATYPAYSFTYTSLTLWSASTYMTPSTFKFENGEIKTDEYSAEMEFIMEYTSTVYHTEASLTNVKTGTFYKCFEYDRIGENLRIIDGIDAPDNGYTDDSYTVDIVYKDLVYTHNTVMIKEGVYKLKE